MPQFPPGPLPALFGDERKQAVARCVRDAIVRALKVEIRCPQPEVRTARNRDLPLAGVTVGDGVTPLFPVLIGSAACPEPGDGQFSRSSGLLGTVAG